MSSAGISLLFAGRKINYLPFFEVSYPCAHSYVSSFTQKLFQYK